MYDYISDFAREHVTSNSQTNLMSHLSMMNGIVRPIIWHGVTTPVLQVVSHIHPQKARVAP